MLTTEMKNIRLVDQENADPDFFFIHVWLQAMRRGFTTMTQNLRFNPWNANMMALLEQQIQYHAHNKTIVFWGRDGMTQVVYLPRYTILKVQHYAELLLRLQEFIKDKHRGKNSHGGFFTAGWRFCTHKSNCPVYCAWL